MADKQQIASGQGNGNSTAIQISRHAALHETRLRTLLVNGTFDSATVKYQVSLNGSDFFDVVNADSITGATAINVDHRCPWHRINVAGGLGSESINAWVI